MNIYLGAGGPGDVSLDRDDVDFLNANEYGILKPVDGFAASMGTKVRKTPRWPRSWANFSLF